MPGVARVHDVGKERGARGVGGEGGVEVEAFEVLRHAHLGERALRRQVGLGGAELVAVGEDHEEGPRAVRPRARADVGPGAAEVAPLRLRGRAVERLAEGRDVAVEGVPFAGRSRRRRPGQAQPQVAV